MAGKESRAIEKVIMEWLLIMPLLDQQELAAISGLSTASVYRVMAQMTAIGFVEEINVSVAGRRKTLRHYLAPFGLATLAAATGTTTPDLLRRSPVSAHWVRLLLGRLETVTAVYRLAAELAATSGIKRFLWYRKLPLDAAIELGDGRVVGVIREGAMASSPHIGQRVGSLLLKSHPDTLLVLAPDEERVREWRHRLARFPVRTFLAVEGGVTVHGPASVPWFPSFDPHPFAFSDLLSLFGRGRLPVEQAGRRLSVPPLTLRGRATSLREGERADDALLPLALNGGEKLLLETVALWPLATLANIAGLLGMPPNKAAVYLRVPITLGLIEKRRIQKRTRFMPSDKGLAFLARRDRLSPHRLARQWSPTLAQTMATDSVARVEGSRLADLLRHVGHTTAVYGFWAELCAQARGAGGEVITVQPPHRAQRRYAVGRSVRTLRPDGYAHVRVPGQDMYCFLEWEQRAAHPAHFRTKLRPYLAYYQTRKPLEDHGAYPVLLAVLRDELVMGHFLRVAAEEIAARPRSMLHVLASYVETLKEQGPLAAIWRAVPGDTPQTFIVAWPVRSAAIKLSVPR